MRALVGVGALSFSLVLVNTASAAMVVRTASGASASDVQSAMTLYRADLGGSLNPNVVGQFPDGRREISWDGAPDGQAAPNLMDPDFFNISSPRGVQFTTPGTGFQLSAAPGNPTATPVNFGNINAAYATQLAPFSGARMFAPLGSVTTIVDFFVPGLVVPARTRGFGAVFCDVDIDGLTKIQYFDAMNNLLFTQPVPATTGDRTFSFAGVTFDDPVVARVVITTGNAPLGAMDTSRGFPTVDVVVMDDFVFGETYSIPSPGVLGVLGVAGLVAGRRRR